MNNNFVSEVVKLLTESNFNQLSDVQIGQDLVGDTAVIKLIHIGELLVAYLIGERDSYRNVENETIVAFREKLIETFNNEELKTLCADLNIEYGDLAADTLSGRLRELVAYGKRNGRLAEISAYSRQQRPHLSWPQFPMLETVTVQPKKELAIVVSINNSTLETAVSYTVENQIDCNYVLLTTVPNYVGNKWLPSSGDWDPAVRDFYHTMQHRDLKIPRVKRHFFLATPVPFAFAIGCTWGLVHQGDKLYHWAGSDYVHVMTSSREWKQG